MKIKSVAVLTSRQSWFVPYASKLVEMLTQADCQSRLFFRHEDIPAEYEVVFILSYFRMVPGDFLQCHRHNLVVHESDLPKGRGWAPLFWQILEGSDSIPVVLFEASELMDQGDIYLQDRIELKGDELHHEIRELQALKTIEMSMRFLDEYNFIKPVPQQGRSTSFPKRTPADSEIDIEKSLKDQFNLLRIVNNQEYPAFFFHRGSKYILKITKDIQ